MASCAFAVVALVALVACASAQSPFLVQNLPGADSYPFDLYAGNMDIGNGAMMFFAYASAVTDTPDTPVVLWLNGGPGCSSIGGGFMSENGPFWPNATGGLDVNTYSWNRAAHMVYLESPLGVGFSYSTSQPSVYPANDLDSAENAYLFLLKFFAEFPALAGRPFWVSGESYGGHYVPELTLRVVEGNEAGSGAMINIQGFLVGNAWTYSYYDNQGCVYDWVSHTIIADNTGAELFAECNFAGIGPLAAAADGAAAKVRSVAKCNDLQNKATKEMGNINIYDIYAHVCASTTGGQGEALYRALASGPETDAAAVFGRHMAARMAAIRTAAHDGLGAEAPVSPCIDNYVQTYLNTPAVQAALHAPSLPYQWTDCSSIVAYNYTDVLKSVIPVYEQLFEHQLKLLVFSGDVDAIVPTPGTKMWLATMNLTETSSFRTWSYDTTGEVGGWVTEYAELTFATVRGAGHMVPGTQPHRAWHMFSHFIAGEPL